MGTGPGSKRFLELGFESERSEKAIKKLAGPDKETRTPGHEGRRLKRMGQFTYWVVNGRKYRELGAKAARMKQNREAQRRFRLRKKGPMAGENAPVPMQEHVANGTAGTEGLSVHEQERDLDAERSEA